MVQRLFSTVGVIWLAATLAFFALRVLPGDAIEAQLVDTGASAESIEQQRAAFGLSDPLPIQYARYLVGLVHGDLGTSFLSGQPVSELIAQQLAPTLTLAIPALIVAVLVGLLLGSTGALNLGFGLSAGCRLLTSLSLSTPIYWTGTLAIYLFSVRFALLPTGSGSLTQLILPVMVLGFATAGAIARVVEASVGEVLKADYIRTARAKGLTGAILFRRHILRAALLPVITVTALQAGFLMSGAVITETLFLRPGLGRLLLQSTVRQDYPVVQGIVVLSALVYALLNAVADVLYRLADPRVTT